MFKNALVCLVAFAVALCVVSDASAGLFRNRRGNDGGNMGAAAGNGLCNMAKQSAVRPNQVIGGDFGIKAEPVAPAPVDRVTEKRADRKVAKSARLSHVSFDAPPSSDRRIATR